MSRADIRTQLVDSGIFGSNVFSYVAPRTTRYPYCVIERDGTEVTEHMEGVDSTDLTRYTFLMVSDDGDELETLRSSLRYFFENDLEAPLFRAFRRGESEAYQFDDGAEIPIYQQSLIYEIWHN
jgi:hypothetical protein